MCSGHRKLYLASLGGHSSLSSGRSPPPSPEDAAVAEREAEEGAWVLDMRLASGVVGVVLTSAAGVLLVQVTSGDAADVSGVV